MKKSKISDPGLLAASCLIMLQHGVVLLILGPMVPEIMKTFHIGESTTGLLLSAGSLGFAVGPIVGGILLDQKGLRLTIVLGFALETVFLVLFGFTPLLGLAVLFNFGLIFMSGQLETAANFIPTRIKGASPGSVMNIIHMCFSIGAFIGPLLIGWFLSRGGRWQSVLWIAAAPTCLLAVFFLIKRFDIAQAVPVKEPFSLKKTLQTARHPAVIFGALTLFLYVGAEIGFASWIVNYLEKEFAFPKFYASCSRSRLWIGILIRRLLNAFAASRMSSKVLMLFSSGLGICTGTMFIFIRSLVPVLIVVFLIGIAMSGVYPNTMAAINRRFTKTVGLVTGLMTLGGGLGSMLFQWIIGLTAEKVGLQISMIFTPILMGLLSVTFFLAIYSLQKIRS